MKTQIETEVAAMQRMTVGQLRSRYSEVFGDETRTGNKAWLVKRIAWRLQAQASGGLSDRARQRAADLANDADLRMSPPPPGRHPEPVTLSRSAPADARLPLPGTILTRDYKGRQLQVRVQEQGFEYAGETYRSLSAVAKVITGTHTNGFLFFRLRKGDVL